MIGAKKSPPPENWREAIPKTDFILVLFDYNHLLSCSEVATIQLIVQYSAGT